MQRVADLVSVRIMWLILASIAVFGCVQHCSADSDEHHWSYHGDDGPSHWADTWSECGGESQSPINIELAKAKYKDIGALDLHTYDKAEGYYFDLTNNGHTALVKVSGAEITVSGGGLSEAYQLAQIHFHWGKTDDKGSEHTVDGKQYPLEIHFVHFKKSYGVAIAMGKEDGLAVLGVFAQVGDEANDGLEKILENIEQIQYESTYSARVDSLILKTMLPPNITDFARYRGSLTTPGCNESVIWTVFKEPITVTSQQMEKFRVLKENKHGQKDVMLADNFRPVQKLNDRTVDVTYHPPSSAQTINSGHLLMSIVVSLAMLIWAV